MLSIPQIELNVCRAYIRHVDSFPIQNDLCHRYRFILKIYEWQLKRKLLKMPLTLDNLQTLKTGHRTIELFLLEIDGGSRKDIIAEIESILQSIAVAFHEEIVAIQAQHPERRAELAREQERYRLMWNAHVEDTLEDEAQRTRIN
ncbi:hypothetical protein BH10ACI4_BH10ACI4_16970 [soil metagenome]